MKNSLSEQYMQRLNDPEQKKKFEAQINASKEELIKLILQWYRPAYRTDIEECKKVSDRIKAENSTNGKHMIEKTPEELLHDVQNWCVMFRYNDELCWFITLMELKVNLWDNKELPIYERWSLVVSPEHRKKGLAGTLIAEMLFHRQNKPMYSITNVEAVKRINERLELKMFKPKELPESMLQAIESIEPLLPNDVIYGNQLFHFIVNEQSH